MGGGCYPEKRDPAEHVRLVASSCNVRRGEQDLVSPGHRKEIPIQPRKGEQFSFHSADRSAGRCLHSGRLP
ncbi:hypothetical protein MRX96_034754 [Rhipicephalus microplus]